MFQTKVEIPSSVIKIGYKDPVMTLGSCFAENIGKKMKDAYFDTEVNPFGVLYNPVSIQHSIELLLENKLFTSSDVFEHHSLWQSFSYSSLFSDTTAEKCLTAINTRFGSAVRFLNKTAFLCITFGTAWVYEERRSGRVVANCHKLPASNFIRRRLSVNEIVDNYTSLILKLKTRFPNLQLVFSVSPIRHWKDGAHGNNVSKSTLLLAIDALQHKFDNIQYFPAYEIMMDELRDYRFYASDMLHPSDVAVDYIWNRFAETYFDTVTIGIKKEFEQLSSDLSHRPVHPESDEYQKFRMATENKISDLIRKYPFLEMRMK